jgi:hypothetical protein
MFQYVGHALILPQIPELAGLFPRGRCWSIALGLRKLRLVPEFRISGENLAYALIPPGSDGIIDDLAGKSSQNPSPKGLNHAKSFKDKSHGRL